MAIEDAIHRKMKSMEENIKDFYVTPPALTEALIYGLKDIKLYGGYLSDIASILDPCCGNGAIGNVLKKYFKNVREYDLYSGYGEVKDFFDETGKYSLIIQNPPYSSKDLFLQHGLSLAEFVIVIMPENVINYTKMNEQFFDREEYVGKIKCYPKFFMTDSPENIKWGGMSTYAWYVWTNDKDWQKKYSVQKFEVIKDIRKFMK